MNKYKITTAVNLLYIFVLYLIFHIIAAITLLFPTALQQSVLNSFAIFLLTAVNVEVRAIPSFNTPTEYSPEQIRNPLER
jgi:hypothetical protein